jgi:hypothetical protein
MQLTTLARRGGTLALLVLAWLALGAAACSGSERAVRRDTGTSVAAVDSPAARDSLAASESLGARPIAGFRSARRLDEHYAKHGSEFGDVSREEYLRRAQQLRDAPARGDILELRRGDGTTSRFDRESGAFIAFDADGTIRTFFRLNDGAAYFRRQARRRTARD